MFRSNGHIKVLSSRLVRYLSSGKKIQQNLCSPTLHPLQLSRTYSTSVPRFSSTVSITYVDPDGVEHEVQAEVGKNLMEVAHDNDIELEGACGGELACSTCHLVFDKDTFDILPEKEDEEDDMLDLAFEVTETSRLGCQIPVKEEYAGIKVRIPDDGFGN